MAKAEHAPTDLLTTAQVAQELGIIPKSVLGLIERGHFPNSRKLPGGKNSTYLIPYSDFVAYLAVREARKQKRRQAKRLAT